MEKQAGTTVYFKTGLLYHGHTGHTMMKGVKDSASLFDIELNQLNRQQLELAFSQFRIPAGFESLVEPDAGFIRSEKAVTLYKEEAIKAGAEIHIKETVIGWEKENST